MPFSEMKTQAQSSSKTKFNIINPESPEVETTFVFNIGKKNKKQTATTQICNSEVGQHENTNNEALNRDSISADASFTFSQARSSFASTSHTCTVQSDQVLSSQSIRKTSFDRVSLKEDHEKLKKNSIESVVELTYPMKTYLSEECKEPRLRRASDRTSKASSGSDSESSTTQKLKQSDGERSGYDNTREITATRKHKRNRLSSGLLERRRSRTSSKDENTDEEEENERGFEPSTSKKSVSYDTRYKKQSKSKYKSNESAGKKGQKDGCDVINKNPSSDPLENSVEESVGIIKPLSSPKCTSKRTKKVSKSSKDDSSWNGVSCTTYNYCCKGQTDEVLSNQGMAVNVFVPTTRKIFSPVRKDSKDETSTVISYVVQEPDPSCVPVFERSNSITYCGNDTEKNENNGESASCKTIDRGDSKELDLSNIQLSEKKEQPKPKFDFVMPPCWIIKQARAQSASPALQRKTVTKSGSNDTIQEKKVSHKIIDGQRENMHKLKEQSNGDESKEVCLNNPRAVKLNELEPCHSDKQSSTDLFTPKDNSKKSSSSSESVENSRLLRKEGSSIPSSLKLRSEAGFPPISPLSVRREMKVMKETAPSIRMMIAKYNQRVHETLELSGTKSPDSGAQSPIAWRSPVTERRINAQMDKYQEEVRRAFQNNSKKEFYPHAKLGQVQKSASAGYIRPFEKGCSNDSINSKGEDKSFEQSLQCHGILKSSSAGAIKTVSPLPVKRQETNGSDINVLVLSPSPALNIRKEIKPIRFEIRSGESISQAIRVNVSSVVTDCKRATATNNNTITQIPDYRPSTLNLQQDNINSSTKVRALKIKKAKEEFLLRGCVGETSCVDRSGTPNCPSTPETPVHNERLLWEGSKTRLSQISCDSESSYENVPMILVSGRELPRDSDGVLLVKSASVGMINMDSTACSSLFCGTSNSPESRDQGAVPKANKSGILSRFRRARLKKNKGKEHKLETVSTLCMQSLVVDINKNNQASSESIPSTSKSCPSSPVLHKKDQSATSWIRNPKRIFKPKQ